jgi:hypothetical protein
MVGIGLMRSKEKFHKARCRSIAFSEFTVLLREATADELLQYVASKRPFPGVHCVKIMLAGMLDRQQRCIRRHRVPS